MLVNQLIETWAFLYVGEDICVAHISWHSLLETSSTAYMPMALEDGASKK